MPVAAATGINFSTASSSSAQVPLAWRESFSAVVNQLLGQSCNSTWQAYMRSEGFAARVARELHVCARSPDVTVVGDMATALQGGLFCAAEWLLSLVYRKDLHAPGRPVEVCLPSGFFKGEANGDGNNCFIGSCVQSLERKHVAMNDLAHTSRCRRIRAAGVAAGKWDPSPAHIESAEPTFAFVLSQLGLSAHQWRCEIYGGNDGDLKQRLGEAAAPNVCYLWNQCGYHFDPLWPDTVVPAIGAFMGHAPQGARMALKNLTSQSSQSSSAAMLEPQTVSAAASNVSNA